jgi:preprotein translocase subunit SecE
MNMVLLSVLLVVASVIFVVLLRRGYFLRISGYCRETQEELKKCTWPTWEELKGSTVVVVVSIAILGGFTMGVDALVTIIVRSIVSI